MLRFLEFTLGLLDFGTFGLWDFGTFGLLDFGTFGLLDFWTFGLLDFGTWHFLTTQNAKGNFLTIESAKSKFGLLTLERGTRLWRPKEPRGRILQGTRARAPPAQLTGCFGKQLEPLRLS